MKNIHLILLMILSSVPSFAGFGEKLPIRWGRVSPAEFSIVPLGGDSAASAIVLCDFSNIEITNRTFYTRHTRIKILKTEGLKYASVEIPYQTRNRHDDFTDLRARTVALENGKVVMYKVTSGQIEDIRINDQWSKKKFTFPNVKPGVIIEFRYTVASLDFEKLDTWYFQREIPTVWSELRFQVPPPFVYLVTFENGRQLAPDEELVYGEKLQWLYSAGARKRSNELKRNNYLLYATSESRYKVWTVNDMKKKIVMRNLPGLSAGTDGQPVTTFYPQVHFDLFESSGNLPRSFRPLVLTTHKDYETRSEWELMHDKMALSGYVQFKLNTWSEFNSELLEHDRFGMYLKKGFGGNSLTDSITRGCKDKLERLEAIYNYVRHNFKWNGEFTMYASQDFKDFIRKQSGSSSDINLLLVNLLRTAGITADPLLIRTSDMDMPEKMYPVKGQFNHVIAVVEIDGTQILLDAVSGTDALNKLHKLDIGTEGWIVREENLGWIDIFSPAKGKEDYDVPVFKL
jgi:hypothetical protein